MPKSFQQDTAATFDPAKTSEEAIRDHVEEITRRTYDFINGAALESDLVMYHISPSGIKTTVPGGNRRLRMTSQSEFMQGVSWIRTQYPSFHIEVESMDVTLHKQYVWLRTAGLLEVWANCASTGGPRYHDSTKRYVNVFEFRFGAGRCVCTKEMAIDGMPGVA